MQALRDDQIDVPSASEVAHHCFIDSSGCVCTDNIVIHASLAAVHAAGPRFCQVVLIKHQAWGAPQELI